MGERPKSPPYPPYESSQRWVILKSSPYPPLSHPKMVHPQRWVIRRIRGIFSPYFWKIKKGEIKYIYGWKAQISSVSSVWVILRWFILMMSHPQRWVITGDTEDILPIFLKNKKVEEIKYIMGERPKSPPCPPYESLRRTRRTFSPCFWKIKKVEEMKYIYGWKAQISPVSSVWVILGWFPKTSHYGGYGGYSPQISEKSWRTKYVYGANARISSVSSVAESLWSL